MKITRAVQQGTRPYQEDRSLILNSSRGLLLAVMDGHVEADVATTCKRLIPKLFRFKGRGAEGALRQLISELHLATARVRGGSTISLALIPKNEKTVSIAVLGDSPVVVFDAADRLHMSPEHNVRSNLKERQAAIDRGGVYEQGYICLPRGAAGLQMSRALGDAVLDKILSREPEVYTLKNPRWVLVASDGLFDPSHGNAEHLLSEVRQFAARNKGAHALMNWAMRRGLGLRDNATALVWSSR